MEPEHVLSYLLFAAVAAGTPGPANVLIAATAANVGVLRGVPCLLGVTLGTASLLGAVALGLGAILLDQPRTLLVMRWLGAVLLLWLAWKIASASSSGNEPNVKPVGFATAALLQWVNPKSWMVAASAAGTYLMPNAGAAWVQAATFAVLFVLAAIPACGVWLVFGAAIKRLLKSRRARRTFNYAMGALLAASVFLVVL